MKSKITIQCISENKNMDFISREKGVFKNINKKPLNELQLQYHSIYKVRRTGGRDWENSKEVSSRSYDFKTDEIPALDERWIQKDHSYHPYQPYYSEVELEENDLYLKKNKLFLGNLKFLLQCNYHQFWNYMIFEPRVRDILNGFLANAVNWYEITHLQGEYLTLYNEIYEKVVQIYLRLLTFKESDSEYMKENVCIKLIMENKLITYPLIINLCLLYGTTCQKLVNILNEIFFANRHEVIYKEELRKIFDHTLLVFEMVSGQICGFEENSVIMPIGIRPKPKRFDPYWVDEVVTYLLDTAASLNAFLSNCSNAIDSALEMGIPYRLTFFYNNVYFTLYKMLKDRADLPFEWPQIKERILDRIGLGRSEFVNVFHVFVTYLIDNIIQSLGDNEKQDDYLEQYLKLISTALEDEFFIFDYQNTNKIDMQLQTISDFHPHIDQMRMNYILQSLSTLPTIETFLSLKEEMKQPKQDFLTLPEVMAVPGPSKEKIKPPNETEFYEIIKSVLDTLPYLGDGFVAECLKSYNYNSSDVISAILDENLLPHLDNLDRNMVYVPPELEEEKPVLAYKGKKPTYKDVKELLDDKSDMEEIKNFVLKTSNVTYDMYDDEYDDRYDDEPNIPYYENDEDKGKPVEKRFEDYELVSDPSDSSSEEEQVTKPKNAFCEDPAIARAKREAHFNQNKNQKRNDVVGKPKGQTQDKAVVHNRDKKNVHKSSRANHNRKSGAQWKRNKGMIPM